MIAGGKLNFLWCIIAKKNDKNHKKWFYQSLHVAISQNNEIID